MLHKAFEKVLQVENVKPNDRVIFRMTYEKCFVKALNTKRSSCEQAGKRIARTWIAECKRLGDDFYTIEELCQLRRAKTDREKAAFFWFFDKFLECVSGAKFWRTQKVHQLVSEARDDHNLKIVTKSDEAFGLLLIDNYLDKWTTSLTLVEEEEEEEEEEVQTASLTNSRKKGKPQAKKQPGKYTEKRKTGTCKFSGWSPAGMARFNELYNMVTLDRKSANAEEMERALLAFCRKEAKMNDVGNGQKEGDAVLVADAIPIEAAWDSNND